LILKMGAAFISETSITLPAATQCK
jgi:hypothetical protein